MDIFNNLNELMMIDSWVLQTFLCKMLCILFTLHLSYYIRVVLQCVLKDIINYSQCCLHFSLLLYEIPHELLCSIRKSNHILQIIWETLYLYALFT